MSNESFISREQFRGQLKNRIEDNWGSKTLHIEAVIERACEHYERITESLRPDHVDEAKRIARLISVCSYPQMFQEGEGEPPSGWRTENLAIGVNDEFAYDTLFYVDKLLESIEQHTEYVRDQIFGSKDAPFTKYEKAIEWMKRNKNIEAETILSQFHSSEELSAIQEEMQYETQKLLNKYEKSFGPAEVSYTDYQLKYVEDNQVHKFTNIFPTKNLHPLLDYLTKFSRKTDLTKEALFLNFMTGIQPVIPRWILKKKEEDEDEHLMARYELKMCVSKITSKDMNQIHETFRKQENTNQIRTIQKNDRILFNVVQEEGGVPDENVDEFWERVYQKCKKKGIDSWNDGYAAKMLWRRLQERLY